MIEAVFVSVNAPIFLYSTITAPAMAGIASKNAYLAAHCLSNPKRRPADIDEPDLEIPGNKANDSNTPIINEFLKVNPITLLSPRVAKCSDNTKDVYKRQGHGNRVCRFRMSDLQDGGADLHAVARPIPRQSPLHLPPLSAVRGASPCLAGRGGVGGGRGPGRVLADARFALRQSGASQGEGPAPVCGRSGRRYGALRGRDGRSHLPAKGPRANRWRPPQPYPRDADVFPGWSGAGRLLRHAELARRGGRGRIAREVAGRLGACRLGASMRRRRMAIEKGRPEAPFRSSDEAMRSPKPG